MPYKVGILCSNCGRTVVWVLDEPDGMLGARGCRGNGCGEIHQGDVDEISEEEADRLREEWS